MMSTRRRRTSRVKVVSTENFVIVNVDGKKARVEGKKARRRTAGKRRAIPLAVAYCFRNSHAAYIQSEETCTFIIRISALCVGEKAT